MNQPINCLDCNGKFDAYGSSVCPHCGERQVMPPNAKFPVPPVPTAGWDASSWLYWWQKNGSHTA